MSVVSVVNIFDQPALWRIEAAEALGIPQHDLVAAVSPGPAFPAVLRSLTTAMPPSTELVIDLGAGAGGASEWIRVATGATVYAVEPAAGARLAASSAFPQLHVLDGRADSVPLPDGIADAVTLIGVTSLLADISSVLEEAERLLAPHGRLAIADLFSNQITTWRSGPNIFRSVERLVSALKFHSFLPVSFGCGAPVPDPQWSSAAEAVDNWIDDHCFDRDGYREWNADRQHLRHDVAAGNLIGAYVVAARFSEFAGPNTPAASKHHQ